MKPHRFFKTIITTILVLIITYSQQGYSQKCENPANTPPNLIGTSTPSFCASAGETLQTLSALFKDPETLTLTWYDEGGTEYEDPVNTELITGKYYAVNTKDGECSNRVEIDVTVNAQGLKGLGGLSLCLSENPSVENVIDYVTALDSYEAGATVHVYSDDKKETELNLEDNVSDDQGVYITQKINGCESGTTGVLIQVSVLALTTSSFQSFCGYENSSPDLDDLGNRFLSDMLEDTWTWYADETSEDSALSNSTPLEDAKTYYLVGKSKFGSCSNIDRIAIKVIMEDPPYAGEDGSLTSCEKGFNGGNLYKYLGGGTPEEGGVWSFESSETSETPTISGGYLGTVGPDALDGIYTYTITSDSGVCTSTSTVEIKLGRTPAPTIVDASPFFCEDNKVQLSDLEGDVSGTELKWYNAYGVLLANTEYITPETTYYVSQVTGGCESKEKLKITPLISITPIPTIVNDTLTYCVTDNVSTATIETLITGKNLQFYETIDKGNLYNESEALDPGTYSFYVTQTLKQREFFCESVNRLLVKVTIYDPIAPTGKENLTFCKIDKPTTENLSDAITNTTGATIKWYNASTGGTEYLINDTTYLTDGTYYASQTITYTNANNNLFSCEGTERLPVTVTINDTNAPTGDDLTFCAMDKPRISHLSVKGEGIKWYKTKFKEKNDLYTDSNEELENGKVYYASQTVNGGCESAERLGITVYLNNPSKPNGGNLTFCKIDKPTRKNLSDAITNTTGATIKWYDTPSGGTEYLINNTTDLTNGTYYASQTITYTNANGDSFSCEGTERLLVTVTIKDTDAPVITEGNNLYFCKVDEIAIEELSASLALNNSNSNDIKWYDAPTEGVEYKDQHVFLEDGKTYYASQTINGCESTLRLALTVNINDPSAPKGDKNQSFCAINNPTLNSLSVTGATIKWYDAPSGGSAYEKPEDIDLVNGSTYYASQTLNYGAVSCEGIERLAVTVTIIDPDPPTGTGGDLTFCAIDEPTFNDLSNAISTTAGSTTIKWYDDATKGIKYSDGTKLDPDVPIYYASQTMEYTDANGTTIFCESAKRLTVTVIFEDPAPPAVEEVRFCIDQNPTIADLYVSLGATVKIYDAPTGGNSYSSSSKKLLVDTQIYYVSTIKTINGSICEGSVRSPVKVLLTLRPNAPVVAEEEKIQTFCTFPSSVVGDLKIASMDKLTWYKEASGGTALAEETSLESGKYYASNVISSGCESERSEVMVSLVTVDSPIFTPGGNEFCKVEYPTFNDLSESIENNDVGTVSWFSSPSILDTALSSTDSLVHDTTYYGFMVNDQGCFSSTPVEVTVDLEKCEAFSNITLYEGFSPNGDGDNDSFMIPNLRELYPNFRVLFFNRWGNPVYEADITKPDWNGRLDGDDGNEMLPTGVYYFIIYFNQDGLSPKQGSLFLNR